MDKEFRSQRLGDHQNNKRTVLGSAFQKSLRTVGISHAQRAANTSRQFNGLFPDFFMVRVEGLEPPRLAAPEPKSGASTNFATPA